MPNSKTLAQAILAAFCAILCALSSLGGGGMNRRRILASLGAKHERMITLHPTSVMGAAGSFVTNHADECGAVLLYLPCFQDHSYLVRCEHGDWIGTFNQSRTLFDDSFKRVEWIGYYKEYLSRQSGLTFIGGQFGSSYCTMNIGRGSENTFCYFDTTTGKDIILNGVILSDDVVPIVI